MADKVQVVKFTGNNTDLYTRESADALRASAQVIVPETHTVLLVKDGIVSEALAAGRHDIFDVKNGLFGPKKSDESATVDFVFISKTVKLPMLWGTPAPIRTVDPETGVHVTVGFNGELEFRVGTPRKFYLELVGSETDYDIVKLKKRVQTRLMSVVEQFITRAVDEENMCYADFTLKKVEIAQKIKGNVAEFLDKGYGLELCSFTIAGATLADGDYLNMERKRNEAASSSMFCPHCGKKIARDSKFCPECGKAVAGERVCPNCGKHNGSGVKFCPECGTKL